MTRPLAPATHPKPELLAPAGSWEAFLAGLEAGADAFYLGLREWSARGRAANFTLEDLRRLVPVARAEGRRVYVALNTLLQEDEVLRAARAVWDLLCLEVDALILQDLGLWRLCREVFPEARLHASTQMSVHNSAGVRRLAKMGFSRVVLARECTLAEVRAIRAASDLPLEVFVHGALCYGLSGQCLASTALGGGSANRGWCAQPCRWNYRTDTGAATHPFSPSDLSLLERVPELARAGVSALKIEGRLKGAAYVEAVVRAFRTALDASESEWEDALGAARELLAGAEGRPATEGFADAPRPRQVLLGGGQPGLGTQLGRVVGWRGGSAVVASRTRLHRGDRLRIAPGSGGKGVAVTLRELHREGADGGERYRFPCPSPVATGDAVYRVKTARGEEREQELARRARSLGKGSGGGGLPVRATVRLEDGVLRVWAACGPAAVELLAPMPRFPAERSGLTARVLEAHLGKLGDTGFRLASLAVSGELPPVVVPPSAFKEVRRLLATELRAALEAEVQARLARCRELRAAGAPGPHGQRPVAPGEHAPRLWARVEVPDALRAALEGPFPRVVAALNRACLEARRAPEMGPGSRERICWELPPWLSEGALPLYRRWLEILAAEGFYRVVLTNLGHLELLEGLGLTPLAGRELHALNGWAAQALGALGCAAFTPSPETGAGNLRAVAAAGWPLRPVAYAYGSPPLFLTRLDPGVTLAPGAVAETADGRCLAWSPGPEPPEPAAGPGAKGCLPAQEPGWARVYGPEPFSWSHRGRELAELGIADLLCDFQGRPFSAGELRAVAQAVAAGRKLPGTTEGNWSSGLR
ncbi:MAG: U32 family peptidase [Thermodesulfobacteriota bacterium]